MSRALWVNEGAEIGDFNRLRSYGITHLYYSERTHTKAHINQARSQGFLVGVYTNPQWYGYEPAKDNRLRVSRRVTALDGDNKQMDVQLNHEKGAALKAGLVDGGNQYAIDWFYWWRRVRPQRATSWTMEGFQGGWFYPAMRATALTGTLFVPQAYDGAMNAWDSYGVVKDLVDWGVDFKRIVPFYDAPEVMRRGASGFFYMEHRLP
jgi:hypothetical protein